MNILKNGLLIIWNLFLSLFIGAYTACQASWNLPQAKNPKEFFWYAIVTYFAPLTGAIAGFRKELQRISKRGKSSE
jgi:hypothetical protein